MDPCPAPVCAVQCARVGLLVNIEHRLRWWLPTKEQGKGQEEKQEVAKAEGEADRGRQRGSPRGAGRSRWRPTAAQARSCRCGCRLQASRPGQGGRSPRFSYRIIRVLVACPSKVAQMKAARCCYMWVLERSESDENWNYAVRKTRREPRYRIQYDSAENSGSSLLAAALCGGADAPRAPGRPQMGGVVACLEGPPGPAPTSGISVSAPGGTGNPRCVPGTWGCSGEVGSGPPWDL